MLRDSDGHLVPNIRWATQLAMIAGGKYVAGAEPTSNSPSSPHRLPNVYAELGTTMASMIVTFPIALAHLLGQQLYYMGSQNIVFGSDSMWYGGPQWQIDALWRFQIPEVLQQQWGYPAITQMDKRNILGLNSARLYGLTGRKAIAIGTKGSPYRQGSLPNYPTELQPGSRLDNVLHGTRLPHPHHTSGVTAYSRRQADHSEETIRRNGPRTKQHLARLGSHLNESGGQTRIAPSRSGRSSVGVFPVGFVLSAESVRSKGTKGACERGC